MSEKYVDLMSAKQKYETEKEKQQQRDIGERRMYETVYRIKGVKDIIVALDKTVLREKRESVADDGEWRITLIITQKLLTHLKSGKVRAQIWTNVKSNVHDLGKLLREAGLNNRYDKLTFVVLDEGRGDILLHVKWPIPQP